MTLRLLPPGNVIGKGPHAFPLCEATMSLLDVRLDGWLMDTRLQEIMK